MDSTTICGWARRNGRPILITRTEDGIELNVNGKQIALPDIAQPAHAAWAQEHGEIDVDVTESLHIERLGTEQGITIISAQEIDEATKSGIRSLLSAAGHSSDVSFVDGAATAIRIDGTHGALQQDVQRHIKVISKEISATN